MAFLRAYLDPNSPTYGNGCQSYKAVYRCSTNSATVNACRLLQKPKVKAVMRDIMSVELEVVIEQLAQVIKGEFIIESVTERFDKDGNFKGKIIVTRNPNVDEIVGAIELLGKMSGWN